MTDKLLLKCIELKISYFNTRCNADSEQIDIVSSTNKQVRKNLKIEMLFPY